MQYLEYDDLRLYLPQDQNHRWQGIQGALAPDRFHRATDDDYWRAQQRQILARKFDNRMAGAADQPCDARPDGGNGIPHLPTDEKGQLWQSKNIWILARICKCRLYRLPHSRFDFRKRHRQLYGRILRCILRYYVIGRSIWHHHGSCVLHNIKEIFTKYDCKEIKEN